MSDFRCYNCWGLIGYRGTKQTISCSRCNTELFSYDLQEEIIEGIKRPPDEYILLLGALESRLAKMHEIFKGTTDIIAGPGVRYRPAAIYYRHGSTYATMPIIYEILTCASIFDEDAINRCRLFAQTAENRFGQFHVVTRETCGNGMAQPLVDKMMHDNGIQKANIIMIGSAEMNP